MENNEASAYYDETASSIIPYPEIAVCLEQIDRLYPKDSYKFRIPALTPDMNNVETATEKKIPQTNKAVENEVNNIEVKDVNIGNYIELPMPKELLSFVGRDYKVTGRVSINGNGSTSFSAQETYSGSGSHSGQGSVNASGSVSDPGGRVDVSGNVSVNGSVSGTVSTSGTMTFNGDGSFAIDGDIKLVPTDRYIKAGSQWIVLFIGGDVNKPRLIAPYEIMK